MTRTKVNKNLFLNKIRHGSHRSRTVLRFTRLRQSMYPQCKRSEGNFL